MTNEDLPFLVRRIFLIIVYIYICMYIYNIIYKYVLYYNMVYIFSTIIIIFSYIYIYFLIIYNYILYIFVVSQHEFNSDFIQQICYNRSQLGLFVAGAHIMFIGFPLVFVPGLFAPVNLDLFLEQLTLGKAADFSMWFSMWIHGEFMAFNGICHGIQWHSYGNYIGVTASLRPLKNVHPAKWWAGILVERAPFDI